MLWNENDRYVQQTDVSSNNNSITSRALFTFADQQCVTTFYEKILNL